MRGGATSGNSFNERCEGAPVEAIAVDVSEFDLGSSETLAGVETSSLDLSVDTGLSILAGRGWPSDFIVPLSSSMMRLLELLEFEGRLTW